MNGELIITIVNDGFSGKVMDCALKGGAKGGTVLSGRGSGFSDTEKIFGITITPEKQAVLILVPTEKKQEVMKSIIEGVGLNTMGKGICFSVPVSDILGVSLGFNTEETEKETPTEKE